MPPSATHTKQFNLRDKQLAERKLLLTVVEWKEGNTIVRELLSAKIASSEIDYNPDAETVTDVLGGTRTFVKKTQPQQELEGYSIFGGSKLGTKLNDIRRRNAISELKQFTVYVITAFVLTNHGYEAEKHVNCTIMYDSLGGASKLEFPVTIYYSNDIDNGVVDKLSDDFTFTSYSTLIGIDDVNVSFVNYGNLGLSEVIQSAELPVNLTLVGGNLMVSYNEEASVSFAIQNGNLFMQLEE